MLSSPPPPTSPSSTSSSIISNTITTTATAAAAAITTTSTSLNIINTSDLSASAITPGSNHHNNSNRHLNLNYHNNYNHNQSTNYNNYNHLPSEMSPSAPAIGATPIDMVIVSGSTTTTSSSSSNTSSSSSSTPPPTSASLLAINNIGNSNTSTTVNTLCSSSSSLSISSTITTTTTATASSSSSSTTTTTTVKQANMMSMVMIKECLCVGCKQPIRDRYLMCINEHYWHESCLQCTVCRIMLTNSCYVKERKIYCKNDYNKLYATKCTNCLESINSNELVMRVHEYIYHLSCFICIWCKRQLKKGDKFALRGHQPICEIDLTKTSDTHHSHHLLTTLNNVNNNIEQSSHLSILNHDINYDMINGLSPPSSTAAMTNDKSLHLTMLQPSSIGHDNNNISDHHQYSPRTLTICDSSMINKNERQQSQPAPSLPLTSTNSQQSYSSPSSHNTSNCNNNSTNNINNNNSPLPIKQDGRRGPKRPRTILTTAQRRAFKASFDVSQKPCRKVRETLAKETGLSVRIVQVWFQNQRAKLKKIQRKQQQQQLAQGGGGLLIGNGSESGGGIGSSDKSRDDTSDEDDDDDDEDDVDDESQQFSIPYLLQSPDAGSYYSGRGEDDGFTVKSEMGCMDDSETSLCEMDDNNCMRSSNSDSDHRSSLSSSTAAAAATTATTLPFGALSMIGTNINTNSNISSNNSHLSTTNHIMFSPPPPPLSASTTSQCIPIQHHHNHNHHPHHHHHHQQQSNILHLTNNTQLSNSTSTTTATSITNMTPIDKLYSMQNSYFNNNPPSECEC